MLVSKLNPLNGRITLLTKCYFDYINPPPIDKKALLVFASETGINSIDCHEITNNLVQYFKRRTRSCELTNMHLFSFPVSFLDISCMVVCTMRFMPGIRHLNG